MKTTYKAMPNLRGEAYEVYVDGKYRGIVCRCKRQGQGRGWECNGCFANTRGAAVRLAVR